MLINYKYAVDDIKTISNNSVIVNHWNGPLESNNSFAGELWFNMADNSPSHCMLISCRSNTVSFGGWNLQIVGGKMGLQIGTGNEWSGISSRTGPTVTKNHWHHAAWLINNSNNTTEMYLDGIKYEDTLPRNYLVASNQLTIGALNSNESNFRFIGQIRDVKLGADLVRVEGTNYNSIIDIPLQINDMDVSNFINILDQYAADREWIQQAVNRLRQELQEELDLNQKLLELSSVDGSFLVTKVEDFMTNYASEITQFEIELQQIFTDLQRLIGENSQLMNSNKVLKERMIQLNNNSIDQSIINIRQLIDSNVELLKNNNRWGDTADTAFKFVQS